jgi:hypothetical protein
VTLRPLWDALLAAEAVEYTSKETYRKAARAAGLRVCEYCQKIMPDYDHSRTCDGCGLPWGWDTQQGRRDRQAEQLDAKIAKLQQERATIK